MRVRLADQRALALLSATGTHAERVAAALGQFTGRHGGQHQGAIGELKRRTTPTPEGVLLRAIKRALEHEIDCVFWRNSAGVATYNGARVPYGLALGASDLIGLVRCDALGGLARFAALEVKTPDGVVSAHQQAFLETVRRVGGFGCVARSVAEAGAALERARTGASE